MSGRSRGEGAVRHRREWPRGSETSPLCCGGGGDLRPRGISPPPSGLGPSPITLRQYQGLRLPSGSPGCPLRSAKDATLGAGGEEEEWGWGSLEVSPHSQGTRGRPSAPLPPCGQGHRRGGNAAGWHGEEISEESLPAAANPAPH